MAGKIKDSCVKCRFTDKKLSGQLMAVLPAQLKVPCPVFSNVGVDLFGPIETKIVGGGKATRRGSGTIKCWVLLVVCLNVKALKLYIMAGYSTEEFLSAYYQFTSDHSKP